MCGSFGCSFTLYFHLFTTLLFVILCVAPLVTTALVSKVKVRRLTCSKSLTQALGGDTEGAVFLLPGAVVAPHIRDGYMEVGETE